jgi:hypothetical protein
LGGVAQSKLVLQHVQVQGPIGGPTVWQQEQVEWASQLMVAGQTVAGPQVQTYSSLATAAAVEINTTASASDGTHGKREPACLMIVMCAPPREMAFVRNRGYGGGKVHSWFFRKGGLIRERKMNNRLLPAMRQIHCRFIARVPVFR